MSLLNNFRKNRAAVQAIAGSQFDKPKQADFIGMPKDQVVFQADTDLAELTVIERKYKDTSYKEVFVVDFNLVEHLKKNSYRVKRMDMVKTESGECRIVLQTLNYSNSWVDSNLEAMEIAQEQPIFVVRDKDAGVYEAHKAEGTSSITISESDIESAYLQAFGEYEIDSLDHPALEGLVAIDVQRDVVDRSEIEQKEESDVDDNDNGFEELADELPELEEDLLLDDELLDDSDELLAGLDWDTCTNDAV